MTTSCGWELGKWVCREEIPHEPLNFITKNPFTEEYNRNLAAEEAQNSADEATRNERLDDLVRRAVAQAILAGDCDRAKTIALSDGNLDLAQQAMSLCTPK